MMKFMMDESNLAIEAWVDNKQLHKGDPEGVDLTKDQAKRLEAAGVSLSEVDTKTTKDNHDQKGAS